MECVPLGTSQVLVSLLVLGAQGAKLAGVGKGRWWQTWQAGCKVSMADEAYGMSVGRVTQLEYARIDYVFLRFRVWRQSDIWVEASPGPARPPNADASRRQWVAEVASNHQRDLDVSVMGNGGRGFSLAMYVDTKCAPVSPKEIKLWISDTPNHSNTLDGNHFSFQVLRPVIVLPKTSTSFHPCHFLTLAVHVSSHEEKVLVVVTTPSTDGEVSGRRCRSFEIGKVADADYRSDSREGTGCWRLALVGRNHPRDRMSARVPYGHLTGVALF